MPRIPITGSLLADLLTAARAHGTRIIDVAVVIETPNTILLLHQGDGDDFRPYRWDLPAATARPPRDQLGDAIRRAVTGTAGYCVAEVTGYLGHHDDTVGDTNRRTFGFAVTVTDPSSMNRDARRGHQWLLTWRNPLRFPDGTTTGLTDLASTALRRPSAHPQPEPAIAEALRAGAAGLYPLEAACELLISTGWLHRDDFARFISTSTSITDGVTELAEIDWQAAITGRDTGLLPCSGGENRTLRLAASIAAGIPVDLQHALSGLDQTSISLVARAVRHANGQRPGDC
jgi:hypothetical protein